MSDDLDRRIDDAAGALRAETSGPSAGAARTRARVLATHRATRARRSQVTSWLALAAAAFLVLGGSTAWAYWTGRLPSWLGGTEPEAASETSPPPPAPVATHPSSRVRVAPEPAPVVPEPPPAEVAPITAAAIEPAMEEAVEVAEAPSTTETPETPGLVVDPAERRAYRTAHALHFDAHDPDGALAAWDRYLRSYPRGRFALEARYNRALCLVRLGRRAEAAEALAPFARGTHGGYRRAEAQALLDAVGGE